MDADIRDALVAIAKASDAPAEAKPVLELVGIALSEMRKMRVALERIANQAETQA